MSDTQIPPKYLRRILEEAGDHPEDYEHVPSSSSERQSMAQAFSLEVDYLDGRRIAGFSWLHYETHEWTDDGDHETLCVIFGSRVVEIIGLNLKVLVEDVRREQLNRIRELPSSLRRQLIELNPENQAIIETVNAYPSFKQIMSEIKGEKDEHETRYARRAK